MSVLKWAQQFGVFMNMLMEFLRIEVLPGSGISFMDAFIWFSIASLLIYFISKTFD